MRVGRTEVGFIALYMQYLARFGVCLVAKLEFAFEN